MFECSIYIHIPFCTRKCDYCHFFVLPNKPEFQEKLMEGLRLEIAKLPPLKATTLYFGGGTPALLSPHYLKELIDHFPAQEITLEANPETLTSEKLHQFAEIGINRLSIGVQSFDDTLLKTLSRQHSAAKAQEAVLAAHQAGIHNISIDLMYDLPDQTLTQWEHSLTTAFSLPITHLSIYNLTIEPHTVFHKYKHQLTQPSEETSLAMFEMLLEKCPLPQYEISAFGRPSLHNTGYWTGRPFFGLGPSAFSYIDGSRYRNIAHLGKYLSHLQNNISPIDFQEKLSPTASRRELLALALRLLHGIDPSDYPLEKELLTSLQEQNLLTKKEGRLALSPLGILHYDAVATEIII